MNTPRENLIEQYSERFGGNAGFDVLRDMEKNMEQLLSPYAIGHWVSVEERLPDDGRVVITRWSNGFTSYYTFVRDRKWCVVSGDSDVTHWLDLSLPEVEG